MRPDADPRIDNAAETRRALLGWFDGNKRDLPWRRSRDPYEIWLSEVMLQQTTVATVTPRWRRFLDRWPTVAQLAAASLEEVLHEWSGLGYYARARNLHKAAQCIVREHDGELPRSFAALRKLPGFGDYTAAAVASIAFGEQVAVLDVNVERVLARLVALRENPRKGAARTGIRRLAETLLDPRRPGDGNQAMMELGALVCTPRSPACHTCPVARYCRARSLGSPEQFPSLPGKKTFEQVREAAVLVTDRRGRVLLLRRPGGVSFGGMWETPRVEIRQGEAGPEAARRAVAELAGLWVVLVPEPVLRIRHTVMQRRIELFVYGASEWEGKPRPCALHEEARWVRPGEWLDLPLSTTQRRIARELASAG